MNLLSKGVALAVVSSGLFALPVTMAGATPTTMVDDNGLAAMTKQADGKVTVTKEPATGKAGFVRSTGDLLPGTAASDAASAADKASAYLAKYGNLLGANSGTLKQARVDKTALGWTVSYAQEYRGVPVFGAVLKANVDKQGDLTAVSGYAAPDLSLSVVPRRSKADAAKTAVAIVTARPPTSAEGKSADTAGLRAAANELVIYREGSVKGEAGPARLAYQVEVTNVTKSGGTIRDTLILDSSSLKPLNRYSMIADAKERHLFTVTDDGDTPDDIADDEWDLLWSEGDGPLPDPELDADQNNLLISAGETYNLYDNLAGRDSYDDEGAPMYTVHNRADLCPNASWNGLYASYCPGVYDDDTVAHEWSHAYTEYTSGLIYQWQSGALNESMSDVFGETVDLVNAREDEGEGDLSVRRTDGLCSRFTRGEITATINSPQEIAGECADAVPFQHGPVFDKQGATADVFVATDPVETEDDEPVGTDLDGCSPFDDQAPSAAAWAYVDRGLCVINDKIQNAVDAGYAGIVVGNNNPERTLVAGGGDFPIYGLMIDYASAQKIKSVENGQFNITVKDTDPEPKDQNARWVLSEKSSAFGGAIRDMWKPTCYGDPGKVSDEEYYCGEDDHGGVHGNSGVPNHAYALAVDGGTYNGVTIEGIGIDKAINLWWRAQSAYLTPTSDFTDLADGLDAACADLTGQPINKATLGDDDPQPADPVTAADCKSISDVAAAVELRGDLAKCDYLPLLDPNAPSLCGDAFVSETLWSEDFEDGLNGWTASSEVVYEGGIHDPWVGNAADEGHDSKYAFGPAGPKGQCTSEAGDFSSRDSIASAPIELTDTVNPKLTFEHSVATELGYDGANVKISVNNGDFTTVPASAYVYNAPTELFTQAEENTNPMAGEDGFTGTDGGSNTSGWGTSVIDLTKAGVKTGDIVVFRFDVGRDGCGGIKGWSVDNIKLIDCKLPTKVTAAHKPEPSTQGEASTAEVTVTRDGSTGSAPVGEVVITDAAGTELGRANLSQGKASVPLPATLPAGKHTLTATYLGNRTLASSSATFNATVTGATTPPTPTKATSETTVKVKGKKVAGAKMRFVVKVKASDGSKPSGKVKIKVKGKKKMTAKVTLKNGKAVLVLKKGLPAGKYKVVAVYPGSDTVDGSRDVAKFKVKRR